MMKCFSVCAFGLLVGCFVVIGCGDSPQTGTERDESSNAPNAARGKIGYSALTLTNPFFKVIGDTMSEEAKKVGYEIIVESANQDVVRQSVQVEEFIVQRVAAIVLNPADSISIGQAILKANEAGIPVFTNDIKYAGEQGEVVCHIATDNLQGGQLAGEAMVRLLGDSGGKTAIIDYPDVESCQMRTQGFREIIDNHNNQNGASQIEIVSILNGRGAREGGYAVAQDMIAAHSDLAAIFAINDPSALGARAALEEAGLHDQVVIIGFDGARAGKEAILAGKIICDPVQFPDEMGRKTIEMIVKYFDGESVPAEMLIPSALYYQADAKNDPSLQQ